MLELRQPLRIFTVYQSPSDYPGSFVVRESRVYSGGQTDMVDPPRAVEPSLYEARMKGVPNWADQRIPRDPEDDPVIVEVWI